MDLKIRLRALLLPLFAVGLVSAPWAQLQAASPKSYTVQQGDNLSSIARQFLGDAALWRAIWDVNPQIERPTELAIGEVLTIPSRDSLPAPRTRRDSSGMLVVKLEPEVRVEPLEQEVITIPRDVIAPFLERPRVLSIKEADSSPYVAGQTGGRLTSGTGDNIFVRGLGDTGLARYGIFRTGGPFTNVSPGAIWGSGGNSVFTGGKVLGYEGILVAEGEVLAVDEVGDATLVITEAFQEVLNGDLVLPLEIEEVSLDYLPSEPTQPVSGYVIKIPAGTTQAGQYDLVALGVGSEHGMRPGDLLNVFQAANTSYDPRLRRTVTLPQERVGVIMVLRSYEQISFAIILEAKRAIHLADHVTDARS